MLLLKFEKQKNFLKILRKMCKNYLRKNSSFLSSYKLQSSILQKTPTSVDI